MPPRKLKICVLQSSYEGVTDRGTATTNVQLDPYCVPQEYDKEGKYEWSEALIKKASAVAQIRDLSRQGFDVFLNLCDGAYDEERAGMEVVEALERFNCTYTGADRTFYEPSKALMKKMAYYYDVKTSPWAFVHEVDMQDDQAALAQVKEATEGLTYPLIVKHHNGYASVGMGRDSKVTEPAQLVQQVRKFVRDFGGALVEQFVAGREFTVLVAEDGADPEQPLAYEPLECVFSGGEEFKHFELKWVDYESMQWVPLGEGNADLCTRLKQAARTAFVALTGCSYGRCDFRVDAQGEVFFLEINPNCGLFYPPNAMGSADYILSRDPTTDHAAFIDHIVEAAQARAERKRLAKRTEVRYRAASGYGLHATRDLPEGEVVVKYEEREHVLVTQGYARKHFPVGSLKQQWFKAYAFGITDEVWVTWSEDPEQWLPLNHSCDPNTWLVGLDLVARRPLARGEQVTCDYATFCTENMAAFDCRCGAARCRGRVTGTDYALPAVVEQYGSHVSDYVASKRAGSSKQT